ncbi:hypothetical protein AUQ37_05325 [Candidatus Methanomethylophilus sp. 1R26]|nr:hypothetical protein AUQ37_05325 [Candidatus Methanomethylophilus sp. 1R26]
MVFPDQFLIHHDSGRCIGRYIGRIDDRKSVFRMYELSEGIHSDNRLSRPRSAFDDDRPKGIVLQRLTGHTDYGRHRFCLCIIVTEEPVPVQRIL